VAKEPDFELAAVEGRVWCRAFVTWLALPDDASKPGEEWLVADQQLYRVGPRSAVGLVSASASAVG